MTQMNETPNIAIVYSCNQWLPEYLKSNYTWLHAGIVNLTALKSAPSIFQSNHFGWESDDRATHIVDFSQLTWKWPSVWPILHNNNKQSTPSEVKSPPPSLHHSVSLLLFAPAGRSWKVQGLEERWSQPNTDTRGGKNEGLTGSLGVMFSSLLPTAETGISRGKPLHSCAEKCRIWLRRSVLLCFWLLRQAEVPHLQKQIQPADLCVWHVS